MLDTAGDLPREKLRQPGDMRRRTGFPHQTNINSFLLGPEQPSEVLSGVRLEPGLGELSLP